MYSTAYRVALTLLLSTVMLPLFAHVELDYPTGGESFESGQNVHVTWHIIIPHDQIDWDLYLSLDGGATWEDLQLGIPVGITYYDWTVPEVNTSMARIRIVQDNEILDYTDMSFPFTITSGLEPPSITMTAQDITISCGADQETAIQSWLDDAGGAEVMVNCGAGQWSNDYDGLSDACGATGNAQVQFTVTDDCGNTAATTAAITVTDVMAPTMSPAEGLVVECDGTGNAMAISQWIANHGGASGIDECSEVTWSDDYEALSDGCGLTGSAEVTFVATDACGHSSTSSAAIQIVDESPPVFAAAARDTTIQCDAGNAEAAIAAWLDNRAGAKATDVCGNVAWTNDFQMPDELCAASQSIDVIFEATDDCGNASTSAATLTIEMTTDVTEQTVEALRVFPNPTDTQLFLRLGTGRPYSALLYDMMGHSLILKKDCDGTCHLDTTHLSSGLYLLLVDTGDQRISKRIIVH
jgi:hypothetical protein